MKREMGDLESKRLQYLSTAFQIKSDARSTSGDSLKLPARPSECTVESINPVSSSNDDNLASGV